MSDPCYRDEEWLREHYVDKDLSTYEIAELAGVTRPTICNWLHRHDLDVADPGPANAGDVDQLKDAEWLRDQYKHQEKSVLDIADDLDVDHKTVRTYLKKHEIEIDSISIGQLRKSGANLELLRDPDWLSEQYHQNELSINEIADMCRVDPATLSRWMDKHEIEKADEGGSRGETDKLRDEQWLRQKYVEDDLSIIDLCELLNLTEPTILRWLDRHNIETTERYPTGKDHPLWRKDTERYRGSSWNDQRKEALRRDQYRCQKCGITEPYHRDRVGHGLHVHHKIPYREFDDHKKANRLDNLITLCGSCHMVVEYNDEVTV